MKTATRTLLTLALFLLTTTPDFATDSVTANISGRLLTPDGSGLGGVQVILSESFSNQITNTTQVDGAFTFTVPAGNWGFHINPDQAPGFIRPTFSFLVTDSTDITNIEAKLLAEDATINGHLQDPNGQPVSGVRIETYRVENDFLTYTLDPVVTDANGNFTVIASKGPWLVVPDCSDALSRSFDCANGLSVDASSGSASPTISLTTGPQPTIDSPRVEITPIGDTGYFNAVLIFTLHGAPGGYDIEARNDVPPFNYSWPDIDFASIPTGATSVEVQIYLNTFPEMPGAQFFKIRRRLAAQ
jgi:hypothetical protein